ncbi:MAG: DUF4189 domain-containing protein [Cyanobacteria bacterium CRU_2_1]|nr:DUF4189 domain-containing protein [Cyanobacteria bacterium RU_5_0]NJR60319.1 DUF4189 domain-containing protein [Cyanobacteria bacterium CRU_2_1]
MNIQPHKQPKSQSDVSGGRFNFLSGARKRWLAITSILVSSAVVTLAPNPAISQSNYRTHAAFAISSSNGNFLGYATQYGTREDAEYNALLACGYSDCEIVLWYSNAYGAAARAEDNTLGWAWAESRSQAELNALEACRNTSYTPDTCGLTLSLHSSEY